jgi:hypothetical protein
MKAEVFDLVVNGYLGLPQMTVLPYVVVSLVLGIGSLAGGRARLLFLRVGALALVLWALVSGAVMLLPFSFPKVESASFFSRNLVEDRPPLDLVGLCIPSNPSICSPITLCLPWSFSEYFLGWHSSVRAKAGYSSWGRTLLPLFGES